MTVVFLTPKFGVRFYRAPATGTSLEQNHSMRKREPHASMTAPGARARIAWGRAYAPTSATAPEEQVQGMRGIADMRA